MKENGYMGLMTSFRRSYYTWLAKSWRYQLDHLPADKHQRPGFLGRWEAKIAEAERKAKM